ncbi:alkaline-phosphatase-like protein [Peziza echinospora]|nr:alkaline-phosphatase-like protein [Peziza echinospora]
MAPAPKNKSDRGPLFSVGRDAPTYASVPSAEDLRGSSSSHLELPSDEEGSDGLETSPDDLDVLKEEEEREKLLSKGGIFGSIGRNGDGGVVIGKPVKGKRKKRRGALRNSGDAMSDVPEDYFHDESEDEHIEEVRRARLDEKLADKRPRAPTLRKTLCISTLLLTFLIVLISTSVRLSVRAPPEIPYHLTPLSNGTHVYHPTTIYISLDGFRADYLKRGLTPTIQSFVNSGVSTPYLTPSFPSITFPNHWTLVTGLYPESHGIVGNEFYDPETKDHYYHTKVESSTKPFWYGGSPIWSLAEERGIKAAIHMWPGSEQYIFHNESFASTLEEFKTQGKNGKMRMKPSYVDKYSVDPIASKAARALEWLDLPLETRPQLILEYVPNVDRIGHQFGPESLEEDEELHQVDELFRLILEGLEKRNLTDIVNIVIVSDHGMSPTANERLVYLEDILGEHMEQIASIDGWPLCGLRPVEGANISEIYAAVRKTHDTWPRDTPTAKKAVITDQKTKKTSPPWKAYLRDVDMPERFHFKENPRIAPLWIVPEVEWAMVTKDDYPPDNFPEGGFHPKGVHGYDNLEKQMRAIFIARGPAFKEVGLHGSGKEWIGMDVHSGEEEFEGSRRSRRSDINGQQVMGKKVKPFGNWEMYGIIGELVFGRQGLQDILGAHNGTLGREGKADSVGVIEALSLLTRLDDEDDEDDDSVDPAKPTRPAVDKVSSTTAVTSTPTAKESQKIGVEVPATGGPGTTAAVEVTSTASSAPPMPTDSSGEPDLENKPASMSWWQWAKYRAAKLKEKLETWWGKVWDEEEKKMKEDAEKTKEKESSS